MMIGALVNSLGRLRITSNSKSNKLKNAFSPQVALDKYLKVDYGGVPFNVFCKNFFDLLSSPRYIK